PPPVRAAGAALGLTLRERAPGGAGAPWLADAERLAVRSLEARPGWPFHAALLAEVTSRRDPGGSGGAERWMTPWRVAARGAPGSAAIRRRWAEACLAAWPRLPEALRPSGLEAISAALTEPEFVSRSMARVSEVLGDEA